MTTFMLSLPSPLPDPPAPISVLPSPPTSPTSPRVATARIRIKIPRRPGSLGNVPSTTSPEGHAGPTRSIPPSLSRIVSTDPDTRGSENRTITPASARPVAGKRRQPSITYYTPSSPSPRSQRPELNRTLSSSVDGPRDGEAVMANGKENVSQRSSLVLGSRSHSTRESVCSSDGVVAREREPLTLVEKHADLLHFIAQKERKCLELRDQLAAHEKELVELKRKWERIVNRGHDPLQNTTLTAGLGGVALDGLKESVRMIAAGFSDLGGATQELESSDENASSKHKSLTHPLRENNNASKARAKRTGSEHFSMSSMSSIQEGAHASDHVPESEDRETMATAHPLSRASSLNSRIYKRASRAIAKEPTMPAGTFVPTAAQQPTLASLDVGMSLILAPSPTLVPPVSDSAEVASARTTPKSPVPGSTWTAAPMNTGPVSSWMDNMGMKLSGLQKGQTFSKGQKRASVLLAGVSDTIASAFSSGPIATTPAPAPTSTSTTTPRIPSSTIPHPTSPAPTKSSLITLQPSPQPQPTSQSRPHPSCKTMTDWLEDDEGQQTIHAGGGLLIPDSKWQPSARATDVTIDGGEAVATAVASFDDDDWNW